jgi:uncharacterized protein YkwD
LTSSHNNAIIPKFEKFMLKKQVIASILAIALTIYSGSLTFATASTNSLQNSNPSSKTDVCSGFFMSPLCGKNEDICIPMQKATLVDEKVTSIPQKTANGLFTISSSKTDNEVKKPVASHTIEVAMATPTRVPSTASSPTPTVAVQSAVAYNQNAEITPSTGGGLNAETIFSMVNQVRVQNGLAPLEKSPEVCAIANERAPELYAEIFVTGNMHAGFARRQPSISYWMTENMIHQNTEQQAVSWWMNSPIHRSAILGNYTHSCVSCQGNSCAMLFTSFVAK